MSPSPFSNLIVIKLLSKPSLGAPIKVVLSLQVEEQLTDASNFGTQEQE
jgi:hypothetical protein